MQITVFYFCIGQNRRDGVNNGWLDECDTVNESYSSDSSRSIIDLINSTSIHTVFAQFPHFNETLVINYHVS